MFDQIICSQTSSKNSMCSKELENLFNNQKTRIEMDINKAIIKTNKLMKKNDSLAIIGSHYLGETIQRVYKNNFDKL